MANYRQRSGEQANFKAEEVIAASRTVDEWKRRCQRQTQCGQLVVSEVHSPNANGVQSSSPGLPELVEGYPGSAIHDRIHNPAGVESCRFNPCRVAATFPPGDPG
jgi:hypothetical protein